MIFLAAPARTIFRGGSILALTVLLLLVSLAAASMGAEVYLPGDGSDGGTGTGTGVPVTQAPEVPGVPPDDDDGSDSFVSNVETLPPKKDDGFPLAPPENPLYILVVVVILGVISTYAPGEIRRIRIETAHRESMAARLSLARGDFVTALAGFDRAIDQAHSAYTRRWNVDKPAEWKLLPDRFYLSLWQGRAAALLGVGRKRSAAATMRMVRELEANVFNGK